MQLTLLFEVYSPTFVEAVAIYEEAFGIHWVEPAVLVSLVEHETGTPAQRQPLSCLQAGFPQPVVEDVFVDDRGGSTT